MAWRTYEQKLNSRYINLPDLPSNNKEYSISFGNLAGGLNIQELDYRLSANESPEMQNLVWRDGVLSSRYGQAWLNSGMLGEGYATYESLWHDRVFCHCGSNIYAYKLTGQATSVYSNVPQVKGTFFLYNDKMYYKTTGAYIVITATYVNNDWVFTAADATANVYTPVTVINASPDNGSGDIYQPENRLSPNKSIWYNAEDKLSAITNNASISVSVEMTAFKRKLPNPGVYIFTYNNGWYYSGSQVSLLDYGITCSGTPSTNNNITVTVTRTSEYHLPVVGKDLVSVVVDGNTLTPESTVLTASPTTLNPSINQATWRSRGMTDGTYTYIYDDDLEPSVQYPDKWTYNGNRINLNEYGITYTSGIATTDDTITLVYVRGQYYYDKALGIVHFVTPPPVTVPATNNTVRITYNAPNTTAYNNIMDCRFAKVYGGSTSLCVVMAGSSTQPNAYFWNGQTSIEMDPTYFPMEQYQLAGASWDKISGFGVQQSYLVIFKEHSVGRTVLDTTELNERTVIDLPYTNINEKIGCDLPWTIQLIDNNLVWCNTEQGVHYLKDSSSAYENNIVCISTKVNGSKTKMGLLLAVRDADSEKVCSTDDTRHYWINAGDKAWLWNYEISDYKDPSWFYQTEIRARAYVIDNEDIYHIDGNGRLTHFENIFMDYGGAINKVYRFATQYFSTYDALKNVNSVLINVRGDMDTETELTYITDYETRKDLTNLITYCWHLVPRNLEYRDLSGSGFAMTFRRKPFCRHVRHFTMVLSNNIAGQNLSIVSAQVFYNYQGRQR